MARIDRTSGFTLIEVLVALVIAALGLALLVAATGSGLENVSAADRTIQGVSLGQSRLAMVGRSLPLRRGDYAGDDGGGFRWHVHIGDPFSRPAAGPQSPALALYPVTVSESWQSGVQQKRLSLYSERLGPP